MELYLSDRHRALRDEARDFTRTAVRAGAPARDRSGEPAYELIAEIGRRRWMGIPFAAEHGGLAADTLALCIVLEELAVADSALAATVSAHTWMGTMPIHLFGSAAQQAKWLPWLCSGQRIAAFGSSPGAEPVRIRATAENGDRRLNGTEHSVQNAGTRLSACVVATVMTGPGETRPELSTIVVPSDAPGYRIGPRDRTIGWRSKDIRRLDFNDCLVPNTELLGTPGAGLEQFLRIIDGNRLGLAAIGIGIAQAALDEASAELTLRPSVPGAMPLAELQAAVVDLSIQVEATRLLAWRAALERDNGHPFALTAAQARLAAGRLALEATEVALQSAGGFGRVDEGETWRLFRDARMLAVSDGSEGTQRAAVAAALGLGRDVTAPAMVPPAPPAAPPLPAQAPAPFVAPPPEPAPEPAPPVQHLPQPPLAAQAPERAVAAQAQPPAPASRHALAGPRAAGIAGDIRAFLSTDLGVAVTGAGLGVLLCLILLATWSV